MGELAAQLGLRRMYMEGEVVVVKQVIKEQVVIAV